MSGSPEPRQILPAAKRRAFCTYFDSNYLSRGIVMLGSLLKHDPSASAHVLCLDETTERVLNTQFPSRVKTIPLERVSAFDPRLPALRATRGLWAYYATHKPTFLRYVMQEYGPFEWVAFIDADTAFYGSLSPVFEEIADASIGLSPHRFSPANSESSKYGVFNAGFICFRDDPEGRLCLSDWQEDCIEWCHDMVLPDGRFMNQGYLTRWPERYRNVAIIRHPGANVAPWNLGSHRIEFANGSVTVDGETLIFFHFSGIRRFKDGSWGARYDVRPFPGVLPKLYQPYIARIERTRKRLLAVYGEAGTGSVRAEQNQPAET
jgi:hypothetical protein